MPPPSGNGNGSGRSGLIAGVSTKLIGALPPAFLVLALLNLFFLGLVAYLVQHNTAARNDMIERIIASCLDRKL